MSQQRPPSSSLPPASSRTGGPRKGLLAIVAIVLLVGVAGVLGAWYVLFRDSGPAAVGTAAPVVPSGAPISSLATTDGTWSIDPSVGSFSDFSDAWVGYRVKEQLVGVGGATAVGRTPDVTGTLRLDGTTLTAVAMSADLRTLKSDESMRDGQLSRQGVQTSQFPTATFSLTSPIHLGTIPAVGQAVNVTATGDMTLHGVTRSVQVPLVATLSGDLIAVTGSLPFTWADYGMTAPQSPQRVLSVEDSGVIEMNLIFRHD